YSKELSGKPQDDSKATFTKIITKQDGYIDLSSPPGLEQLDRMIRAYYPWPGTWTKYEIRSTKSEIFKLLPGGKIQVEGKKSTSLTDFKNGYEKGEEFLKKIGLN
ncbi:MAG: hypothetical protein AAB520_03470, partial [Patescibacteria group bacterium]